MEFQALFCMNRTQTEREINRHLLKTMTIPKNGSKKNLNRTYNVEKTCTQFIAKIVIIRYNLIVQKTWY